jgi:SAM-dependent methyltransferase
VYSEINSQANADHDDSGAIRWDLLLDIVKYSLEVLFTASAFPEYEHTAAVLRAYSRDPQTLALAHGPVLLDVGCGVGGPALVGARLGIAQIVMLDYNAAAVAAARENARKYLPAAVRCQAAVGSVFQMTAGDLTHLEAPILINLYLSTMPRVMEIFLWVFTVASIARGQLDKPLVLMFSQFGVSRGYLGPVEIVFYVLFSAQRDRGTVLVSADTDDLALLENDIRNLAAGRDRSHTCTRLTARALARRIQLKHPDMKMGIKCGDQIDVIAGEQDGEAEDPEEELVFVMHLTPAFADAFLSQVEPGAPLAALFDQFMTSRCSGARLLDNENGGGRCAAGGKCGCFSHPASAQRPRLNTLEAHLAQEPTLLFEE